jgi:hypothetical protein
MSAWTRLRGWARPQATPAPLRFNITTQELLENLGTPSPAMIDEMLLSAHAAFAEVKDRAESAERRATTIQGAIAIAASLTVAGGSLILESAKVPSHAWRIAISVGFAVTVVLFAVAAWRSFLVTWPRFMWASPAATDIVEHAHEPTAEAIKLRRTSDLLVAYGRNDSVARVKLALLGQAVRWLMSALVLLAILATLLAVYSIERSSSQTGRATRETMPAHVCPSLETVPPASQRQHTRPHACTPRSP